MLQGFPRRACLHSHFMTPRVVPNTFAQTVWLYLQLSSTAMVKIQVGDMKLQDLETKIQIVKQSPIIAFLPLTKLDNGSMSPLQHSCATPPCQIVCIIFIVYCIYSFMLYLSMHAISHIRTFNGNRISHF